jgi:hypothetical protein
MGHMLKAGQIERRKVRLTEDSPLITLYAIFSRDRWRAKRNRDWADHYVSLSKQFAKYRRDKSH